MYFVKFGCKTEAATNSYIKTELCWILCYARVSKNLCQIFLQQHFHRTDFTLEVSKVVASTSSRLIWLFNSYYFLNIFKLTWLFFFFLLKLFKNGILTASVLFTRVRDQDIRSDSETEVYFSISYNYIQW